MLCWAAFVVSLATFCLCVLCLLMNEVAHFMAFMVSLATLYLCVLCLLMKEVAHVMLGGFYGFSCHSTATLSTVMTLICANLPHLFRNRVEKWFCEK